MLKKFLNLNSNKILKEFGLKKVGITAGQQLPSFSTVFYQPFLHLYYILLLNMVLLFSKLMYCVHHYSFSDKAYSVEHCAKLKKEHTILNCIHELQCKRPDKHFLSFFHSHCSHFLQGFYEMLLCTESVHL